MSYTLTEQRRQEILSALRQNQKLQNAKIKVQPINGSGDYEFSSRGRNKFGQYCKVEGIVKRNQDVEHLKTI